MSGVNLNPREYDGQAVIEPRGELDLADAAGGAAPELDSRHPGGAR